MSFNIGDKVIRDYKNGMYASIGTVVNITEKRGDVVVDYGHYKETYRSDGRGKGGSAWMAPTIQLLTPEIREKIRKINLIRKCRDTFEKKKDLTAEQAERILAILAEGTEASKEVLYDEHQ